MAKLCTRKRAPRWPRAFAKREVSAWQASGLSQVAFARTRGYPVKRLSHWISRLRKRNLQGEVSRSLVPVRVVGTLPTDASSGTMRSPIEVELCNGIRVRVQADFDEHAFQRVVAVVGRC